jgi:hypothetical protein
MLKRTGFQWKARPVVKTRAVEMTQKIRMNFICANRWL